MLKTEQYQSIILVTPRTTLSKINLFLSACAAPTSSLDLANQQIDKTGYIFYQNSEINLHISELKDKLILPAEEYAVPDYVNLLPNAKREYRSGYHMGVDFSSPMDYPILSLIHI